MVENLLGKMSDFEGPLFPKNVGLGFWMGFDIWPRHCKHVIERGWEDRVPTISGMNPWDPGSDWPGTEAKIEL